MQKIVLGAYYFIIAYTMDELSKLYKRKFNHALEPIKVMLVRQQAMRNKKDWVAFVERTRLSVIEHPYQYLGTTLPDQVIINDLVNLIFDEFLTAIEPRMRVE
jgi:hypothetical protein